jgi:hypothetical protein
VLPVGGECQPAQDTLELTWLRPAEAASPEVAREMSTGHGRLVRRALAFCGQLP